MRNSISRFWQVSCVVVAAISVMLALFQLAQAHGKERPMRYPSFYRTIQVDGLSIF